MTTKAISFLGTTLDRRGRGRSRWDVWRPNVALAMQDDLRLDELHLIYGGEAHRALLEEVAGDIAQVSPATKIVPEEILFDDPWDFREMYGKLFDLSRRLRFDPESERWLVHITTGTHVAQICLFLLTESRHFPAQLVQTNATGRQNPAGAYSIIDLDLSKYDDLAKRFEKARLETTDFLKSGIATRNAAFNATIDEIEKVALRSAEPILLTGPTGSGKSSLARRIHALKKRDGAVRGAFVETNCATLRGDAAMSTLFGHKKGAFTGAAADRAGLLKAADGGILFLDEIGELGADEQAMLLRAIEEKTFLPLGSDKEEKSDFQLICGTNRDLRADVAAGRFREDLLARIDLWSFRLPGLAERREDIEPNLDYELDAFQKKTGRHVSFNAEARRAFLAWALDPATPWRGNFRDLGAIMTRMATLAPQGRIDEATVRKEIARAAAPAAPPPAEAADLAAILGADCADKFDRFDLAQLREVVAVCRRSRTLSEAGRTLFAVSRKAKKSGNDADRLAKYLARFGLAFARLRAAGERPGAGS